MGPERENPHKIIHTFFPQYHVSLVLGILYDPNHDLFPQ